MLVNISVTFHEDILNGFSSNRAKERTALYSVLDIAKVQRGITKKYIPESYVSFLQSAHRLLLVNISMTTPEDILNGFQVTELQSGRHCILFFLYFLRSAFHLMLIDIYMKFHEDILNGFQVTERAQFCN